MNCYAATSNEDEQCECSVVAWVALFYGESLAHSLSLSPSHSIRADHWAIEGVAAVKCKRGCMNGMWSAATEPKSGKNRGTYAKTPIDIQWLVADGSVS